jgi:hypothetical protein
VSRNAGRSSLPTRKNGSRAATSQKHTIGEAGSSSRAFITRIGPPHEMSIDPSSRPAAAAAGAGDSSNSTSTPSPV